MNQDLMDPSMEITMEAPPSPFKPRNRKAGRRKMGFKMGLPPWPVRAIWEAASEEERRQAHERGVLILENWMGRMSRKDLAKQMKLPPLRIWQMSQQALSGMVVGLMAQPRRPRGETYMPDETTNPKPSELLRLHKRVADLERDNKILQELLDLARSFPQQAAPKAPKGKKISRSSNLPPDRSLAPGSQQNEG